MKKKSPCWWCHFPAQLGQSFFFRAFFFAQLYLQNSWLTRMDYLILVWPLSTTFKIHHNEWRASEIPRSSWSEGTSVYDCLHLCSITKVLPSNSSRRVPGNYVFLPLLLCHCSIHPPSTYTHSSTSVSTSILVFCTWQGPWALPCPPRQYLPNFQSSWYSGNVR